MADTFFANSTVIGVAGIAAQSPLAHLSRLTELEGEFQRLEFELGATAALLELNAAAIEASSLRAGAKLLAEGLATQLGCDQVALGIVRSNACRLVAISGVGDIDTHSEQVQRLEAAQNETVLNGSTQVAESESTQAAQGNLAHQRLLASTGRTAVVSVSLRTADQATVAVVTCLVNAAWLRDERRRRLLEAAAHSLASSVEALRRNERWFGWRGKLAGARVWANRKILTAACLAMAAAMCVPWRYQVACECELQPVIRRFIAAPNAGVFERSLVKPGDIVKRDQLLARMDGRELRWELAGLEADHQRAGKSRDVNLATSKVAAAQIDRLEMERFHQKRKLISNRLDNLEIKSPIDGIVLSGDLQRSEGVSLTIGQPLFEIAPLDQMLVEVAVSDDEITRVEPGLPVKIQLAAFPGKTWEGRLERVHPRSEIRDEQNVFIGEVLLENPDQALRPGMKGQAKVATSLRPIGWILLHKPIEYLLRWCW